MGTLGRATRVVLADQVIDTPVEVELLDAGVLKVVRVFVDNGIEHRAVAYYGVGEWKSFDLQMYTLVIDNRDTSTVEYIPGLSSHQVYAAAAEYLMGEPATLPSASAAHCASDLVAHQEVDVYFQNCPRLLLRTVQTPERSHAQAIPGSVAFQS
ncbi:hypothetical protein [Mycolicibacterium mucogenicum]|nr:hypothetical protein [Mycolicibacterium mucogenicum]